jgi:hypothetical protein
MNHKHKAKNWAELTTTQKIGTVVSGIIQIALLIAALWDLRSRPQEEIRGSKKLWTALVFINWIGPIAYFVVGRKR